MAERDKAAECAARGVRRVLFEISTDVDAAITAAQTHLAAEHGNSTRTQALSWLVKQGVKKLPKKSGK